jgi:Zn-dependent peptidase ImmA (M78 family)
MDAAHEMAHAVLHKNVSQDELKKDLKQIEISGLPSCQRFLNAFDNLSA